jgi:hypothetical protein
MALAFLSPLAAQSAVPREQCLGGKLVAIQPDSITVKYNDKTTTLRLAPSAEIWRRGVDLQSTQQLVIGDDIYTECTRAPDSNAVLASMIAAVEKDDAVKMEPHHIVEIRVCMGNLTAKTADTLSLKNDKGTCVIHIPAGTPIWRGEIFHDTSVLQLGDEVGARVTVGYPSETLTADGEIDANVAKTEGTIVEVRADRIVVDQYPGADPQSAYPRGHMTVLVDARTEIEPHGEKLHKGDTVLAVGLDLGHDSFRATKIFIEK